MQTISTKEDLVRTAKGVTGTVDAEESRQLHDMGAIFIDVREPSEWRDGFLTGAIKIPRGLLEFRIEEVIADQNNRIVTYCSAGGRAALAAARLKQMGYAGAISTEAGFEELKSAGLPVSTDSDTGE